MILPFLQVQVQDDNRGGGRYWDNPEYPHSPVACLIGHEALFEGEVQAPTPGYEYTGMDERALPTHFQAEVPHEDWEDWECWSLQEEVA